MDGMHFGFGQGFSGRFDLGAIVGTPGAISAMQRAGVTARELLARHIAGDWGDCAGDWGDCSSSDAASNDRSVESGGRLMSVYRLRSGATIWVITEWDRSVTTLLLPEDY